jgi:transposase
MVHELPCCGFKRDRAPIGAWLDALDARAPKNVVVVAMANKLARIAWAV